MLGVVAVVVFVFAAAVLAAAETSLTNMTRARATALREEERKGAEILESLLQNRERVLSPVLLVVLFCQLAAATIVAALVQDWFGSRWVIAALAIEVVLFFVLAEAVPKAWALQNSSRAALAMAPIVSALLKFPPIRWLTGLLLRVAGFFLPESSGRIAVVASDDELLAFAKAAVDSDVIEQSERKMIESVIDLGDTLVREVMTPRPDMVSLDAAATVDQAIELAIEHGFSRLPITNEGVDDIVGVVHVKHLVGLQRKYGGDEPVSKHMSAPSYIPESKPGDDLLRDMQATQVHLAIVIDEYGGTAGLVTLEDLIEELIGEIVDEFDNESPVLETIFGGVRVHGRMPVDELNDIIEGELPTGDWDTVGGLIFNTLGHVPVEGEVLEVAGLKMTVDGIHDRRITSVQIRQPRGARLDLEAERAAAERGVPTETAEGELAAANKQDESIS